MVSAQQTPVDRVPEVPEVPDWTSGVQSSPAMRQEFGDQMVFVRGQALQHIFEISAGVVPIEPGALNQAHDDGGMLACPQGACE